MYTIQRLPETMFIVEEVSGECIGPNGDRFDFSEYDHGAEFIVDNDTASLSSPLPHAHVSPRPVWPASYSRPSQLFASSTSRPGAKLKATKLPQPSTTVQIVHAVMTKVNNRVTFTELDQPYIHIASEPEATVTHVLSEVRKKWGDHACIVKKERSVS